MFLYAYVPQLIQRVRCPRSAPAELTRRDRSCQHAPVQPSKPRLLSHLRTRQIKLTTRQSLRPIICSTPTGPRQQQKSVEVCSRHHQTHERRDRIILCRQVAESSREHESTYGLHLKVLNIDDPFTQGFT